MDFASAALLLYLLFPTMSVPQRNMAYVLGKTRLSAEEEESERRQVKIFLGYEQPDEATIEPSVSLDSETDVPLPSELENPEFGPQSEGSDLLAGKEKGTGEKKVSAAEKQYINSQNRLRMFEYGEEILSINKSPKGDRSVVSVNEKTITRLRYDGSYRLLDRIVWKNGASVKEDVIIKKTTYLYTAGKDSSAKAYSDNGTPPAYSKPIGIVEELPETKKITETTYDEKGNPITVVYAHFIDDPDAVKEAAEKAAKDKMPNSEAKDSANTTTTTETPAEAAPLAQKKVIDKKTERTYNSENKILTETETTYYEEPDPLRRGKKRSASSTKKNVYEYTLKSPVPDFRFYENGRLRMTTLYIDPDTYEETMYFDYDYLVKTKYSHGRKVLEVIYSGATEVKRTKFE